MNSKLNIPTIPPAVAGLYHHCLEHRLSITDFGAQVATDPELAQVYTSAEITRFMEIYRDAFKAKYITPQGIAPAQRSPRKPSITNRSAIRDYALKASRELRAGKFRRVGEPFFEAIEVELAALIRSIAKTPPQVEASGEADWFINGRTTKLAEDFLNRAVQHLVLRRVKLQTTGKTLK